MIYRYLFLFIFFPLMAQAQDIFEMGRTIRAAGMGGMYIPVASGVDAIFHNPAALARGTGFNIKLLNLEVGINGQEALDLAAAGSSIQDPSDYNQFFGKKVWIEAAGLAGVALPRMGVGFLSETHVSLELHNPGFPQFQTYFLNDTVIGYGGGLALADKIYVGMTLKQIQRWGGDTIDLGLSTIANANSLSSIGDSFQNKGRGYGVDLAIMKDLDAPTSPSIAFTLQDVGYTSFQKTDGASAPPAITQNLNFGLGGSVDLPGLDWFYGFEMRHLMEPDIQIGKKIHLGTEISLPFIDVRAGLGQGYISYGVGLDLLIFRFDVATYTEELGIYPGQTGQNRVIAGLSIDLSFDANFKFTDNNGNRRKLKQRR